MHARHTFTWFPVTLGRFVILAALLLSTIGTPLTASAASGETPGKIFLPVISNGKANIDPPPPTGPLPPTAQQLITKDYAAKLIDFNTAILYLAYALYGDPRLPAKYGGGFMISDPSFFSLAKYPNLPADVKAQLEPFLVRPDDPKSIYNTTPAGIAPDGMATDGTATASEAAASEPAASAGAANAQASSLPCDRNGWAAATNGTLFTVHAKCTGTYEQDIKTTLDYLDALYQPMTDLMGEPILDADMTGGGPQIDIYLLLPLDKLRRYEAEKNPLCADCGGLAAPDDPYVDGKKSSGFIVIDRQLSMGGLYYKQLLAHEFFHILQFSHNEIVTDYFGSVWWFTEASAVWAEIHFVPEVSAKPHQRFSTGFQKSPLSLHAPGDVNILHVYDAYIWPFFMEQEVNAQSVANVWKNLEQVEDNWDDALKWVDHELPFTPNFRRFALRNLNFDLQPGDPIGDRYVFYDPNFPDGVKPQLMVEKLDYKAESPDNPHIFQEIIPPLAAKYYHYTFTSDVQRVDLGMEDVIGEKTVAVQAIIKPRGKPWTVRDLTGQSYVQLCDIEGLYLIVSNEQLILNDNANVVFMVYPLAEPCKCEQVQSAKSWNANVTLSYSINAEDSRMKISETESASVKVHLTESHRDGASISYWAETMEGNGKIHYRNLWLYPTGNYLWSDILGDGKPVPYDWNTASGSRMAITFDLKQCSYDFYLGVWINATETSDDSAPTNKDVGIAHIGSAEYFIPDQAAIITGAGSFPGHTTDYVMDKTDREPFFAQDDYDIYRILGGEDKLGAAEVSWVFTPSEEE